MSQKNSARGGILPGMRLAPSPFCLGAAQFGTGTEKELCNRFLDVFFEGGGNFVDLAHIYGAWAPGGEGAAEKVVGEWVRRNGVRDRVVISTKGGHPPLSDFSAKRCAPADLRQDLLESLDRLRVAHVDYYWLHRDDTDRPVSEFIDTLAGFVREGLISAFGASNWSTARIEEANAYASRAGLPGFSASQVGWAYAEYPHAKPPLPGMRYLDPDAFQWHVTSGLPLIPFSSQAHGYFGKENAAWAQAGFTGEAPIAADYDSSGNRQRLLRAIALAEQKGCTANQISLAYLRSQAFPVIPVVGALEPEHVVEALGAASVTLDTNELQCLARGEE